MQTIIVVEYDEAWPKIFQRLHSNLWPLVADFASSIEHVGSTSVPGLAAKPVIDMSVVVRSEAEVRLAIDRLATVGYLHRGNLGIEGREAFQIPAGSPAHHLYVCLEGSLGLQNHLAVRNYLRTHRDMAQAYGELKKKLALEFPNDIESYIDGKTDLLLNILREAGFPPDRLKAIEDGNRKKIDAGDSDLGRRHKKFF
jgi:GrpB-like predicted nucleotidyltransferase (UPF0157 family)